MFDYGCYPLWAIDDEIRERFGYNISELDKLGLSASTIKLINLNSKYYDSRLNPIYQGFPSFWSGRMHAFFQFSIKYLLEKINKEIGDRYQIENHEMEEFDREIDIERIDSFVAEFVNDPVKYAIENGISFHSEESLRQEISSAYKEWSDKEYKIYSY